MAADLAKTFGISIYTIGVGSGAGEAPYPIQTPLGTVVRNMPVDLDEPTMQQIADVSGGAYFRATDNESLAAIYKKIASWRRPSSRRGTIIRPTRSSSSSSLPQPSSSSWSTSCARRSYAPIRKTMNIHFHSPEYLYLLFALLPLLALSLFAYWRRRQMLKRFADKELGQALAPLASGKKYVLRDLLLLIAGALIIVVLARHSWRVVVTRGRTIRVSKR